jgi:hypothetical protein
MDSTRVWKPNSCFTLFRLGLVKVAWSKRRLVICRMSVMITHYLNE